MVLVLIVGFRLLCAGQNHNQWTIFDRRYNNIKTDSFGFCIREHRCLIIIILIIYLSLYNNNYFTKQNVKCKIIKNNNKYMYMYIYISIKIYKI